MDTGHFQSRRFLLTRYDERNANGQCQNCNQWNSGEQYKHGLAVDDKFGEGTAQELENKARGMQKMTKQDVMELAREFKTMAEEIAEQKGIQI
jgi:predicted ATP-dependent serine protease